MSIIVRDGLKFKSTPYPWLGEIPSDWSISRVDAFAATQRRNISSASLKEQVVKHYSIPSVQEFADGLEEDEESDED